MGLVLRLKTVNKTYYPMYIPFSTELKTTYLYSTVAKWTTALPSQWVANNIGSPVISFIGRASDSEYIEQWSKLGGACVAWDPDIDSNIKLYLGTPGNSNYLTFNSTTNQLHFYKADGTYMGVTYCGSNSWAPSYGLFVNVNTSGDITGFGTIAYFANTIYQDVCDVCDYDHRSIATGSLRGPQGSMTPDLFTEWIGTDSIENVDTDPNTSAEESGPGGGLDGIYDGTGDVIGVPALPTSSVADTGLITIWNPTLAQVKSMASFMWTNTWTDAFFKILSTPMDAILGLSIVPVAVPQEENTSFIKFGNVTSDVSAYKATSQYVEVDCGSLTIQKYWDSALDFSPYTKMQLSLPYIGVREINTDEVMGKTIAIKYHVDVLTGSLVAYVSCGGTLMYQFEGNCAVQIPVTGESFTEVLSALVSAVGAAGSLLSAGSGGKSTAQNLMNGLSTTVDAVQSAKPRVQHSGEVTGAGAQMSHQKPYLIIERPRQSLAKNYNKFEGYPSNITSLLSSLRGYTSIESIHLENVPATSEELDEIVSLLREGVIL